VERSILESEIKPKSPEEALPKIRVVLAVCIPDMRRMSEDAAQLEELITHCSILIPPAKRFVLDESPTSRQLHTVAIS
jgi:hypothetical protein